MVQDTRGFQKRNLKRRVRYRAAAESCSFTRPRWIWWRLDVVFVVVIGNVLFGPFSRSDEGYLTMHTHHSGFFRKMDWSAEESNDVRTARGNKLFPLRLLLVESTCFILKCLLTRCMEWASNVGLTRARAVGVPQPPTHVTLITTLSPKQYCGAMLWDLAAAGEANRS